MGTMKKIHFILITFFLFGTTQKMEAQEYRYSSPQPLGEEINSEAEESMPLYSPTDSTLYFVRTLHRKNTGGMMGGQDIWYSKKTSANAWAPADNNLSTLNNHGNNAVVGISEAGNTIYLLNSYETSNSRGAGLAFAFNRNQTWTTPADISVSKLEAKEGKYYGYYINSNETVLFLSMQGEDSYGQEDLYVSVKNTTSGTWSSPVHLGPKINTQGYEISPFLSEDGKTLYFASSGHPGFGDADIFAATRLGASWTNWSAPVNLGQSINSPAFDAYFSITPDNQVYFASSRNQTSADIYTARMITGDNQEVVDSGKKEVFTLTEEERQLNAETIALIEETKALLEEFNRAKAGKTDNKLQNTEELPAPKAIYFSLNSANIEPDSAGLAALVNELKKQRKLQVEIVGHADDLGSSDYNLKLSINRAMAAKEYLVSQGVSEERIITYGKGESAPAASGTSDESRKLNRRVTISFLRL